MGFLDPRNLLWALALAVLAIIYLRSRSRPTIEVSSLMLFDEIPAPVAQVRHIRIDPLFWLEVATLGALVLAIAGLYAMTPARAAHGRSHALVFDLGAAMSAREKGTQLLETAKKQALEIVDEAPIGDEFAVIGYALEAQVRTPQTQNLEAVRKAIKDLEPMAVAVHPSALAAAMMRARGSSEIALFTDRPPPNDAISDANSSARVDVHRIEHNDENIAIVSLDPGNLGVSPGRAVLRNFSAKPLLSDFAVDLAGTDVFRHAIMLAPREQAVVPFGPLKSGGLLRARILTTDAIEADNQRFTNAPLSNSARVVVISPDPVARDDLARVLLAVDPDFRIEAVDPAKFAANHSDSSHATFDLAVMHDCYVSGIAANSILLIYPPTAVPPSAQLPGLRVTATLHEAELDAGNDSSTGGTQLGATRVVVVPEWMDVLASGEQVKDSMPLPLAAVGKIPGGQLGILAFDIRDRLLLDPDRLDALVVGVNLLKRLVARGDIQVVATGEYVNVPVGGQVEVVRPNGMRVTLSPDQWGRVRFRPLEAGRYVINSGDRRVEILANYYDAGESDLAQKALGASALPSREAASATPLHEPRQVQPLAFALIALALAAFLFESAVLVRHAARWGIRHV